MFNSTVQWGSNISPSGMYQTTGYILLQLEAKDNTITLPTEAIVFNNLDFWERGREERVEHRVLEEKKTKGTAHQES